MQKPTLTPVEACPLCDCRARVPVLEGGPALELVRCCDCELVYATSHYSGSFLAEGYYGGRAEASQHSRRGVDRKRLELARYDRISGDWLRQCEHGSSALDIGCHTGLLLDALRERGFETWGVERSPAAAVAQAAGHRMLRVDVEDESIAVAQRYQLITLTHVLEHLRRPVRVLKWIGEHLDAGGKALVEVPNWRDLSRPLWGRYYRPLELGDHISFFTVDTLTQAAQTAGLQVDVIWSGPRLAGLLFPNILSAVDLIRSRRQAAAPSVATRDDAGGGTGPQSRDRWMCRVLGAMDHVDPLLESVLGAQWKGPNIVAFLSVAKT